MTKATTFTCAGPCKRPLQSYQLDPKGYCIPCARGDRPGRIAATMATPEET